MLGKMIEQERGRLNERSSTNESSIRLVVSTTPCEHKSEGVLRFDFSREKREDGMFGWSHRPECNRSVCSKEWVKRRLEGESNHRLPVVADGVDSPHLPACGFLAPGDPRIIAS